MGKCDLTVLDQLRRSYELVEANVMRGTVHLMTARQYWAWRPALSGTLKRVVGGFCPGLWSRVDYDELRGWGTDLVGDRAGMTRGEMGAAASQRFSDAEAKDLGFALRMVLPIVEVPTGTTWRPGATTYALASSVLPGGPLPEEAGRVDLAASFADAFGSDDPDDFAYWSGVTKGDARRVIQPIDHDGGSDDAGRQPTLLLPEFDNIYFCRRKSDAPLYGAKRDRRLSPARMPGSLIEDGRVVAHWSATVARGLELEPWTDIGRSALTEWNRFCDWYAGQD